MNQRNERLGSSPRDGEADAGSSESPRPRRPLGVVIASAMDGARVLARKHVELARIEMVEAMSVRAKGAGMMTAAALFGLFALGFAAASVSAALDLVLPAWAAHLIVSALFVGIAGVLMLIGRRAMREAPTAPVRTQDILKEDARWAKQQIAR